MVKFSSNTGNGDKKHHSGDDELSLYKTIFETAPILFWIKDTRNRIIKISEKAAALYGRSVSEIEGNSLHSFLPKEISDQSWEQDKEIMRTQKPMMNIPYAYNLNDSGKNIFVRLSKVPISDNKGNVTHIFVYGDDITEQKETEESLRKSTARSTALLNAIPDLLFVTDKKGIFSDFRADESLLYVKPEMVIGKKVSDLLPPGVAEKCLWYIQEASRTKELQTFEYSLDVKGTSRFFEARIIAEEENVVSLIRDISDRKKMENDIYRSETRYKEFRNEIMHTLSDALVSTMSLNDFYSLVQTSLSRFIPAESLCIFLYREQDKTHTCSYCSKTEDCSEKKLKSESGMLDFVMKSMQPVVFDKVEFKAILRDHHLKHKGEIPAWWMGVPMKAGKDYLGMITIGHYSEDQKLDKNALETVTLVSNFVAIAVSKKGTEEKLFQQVDFLNSLMQNVPEAIYVKDSDSRFVRVSNTFANRLGITDPEELTGKNDFDLYNNAHAREAFDDEKKIMSTGIPLIAKDELEIWPNGERRWVNSSKMAWHNAEGEVMGTFGISFDITKRKHAEEALKKNQAMLEAVLNSIPQSVFWKDRDGRFLGCNTIFVSMTGFNHPSQIIGKSDFDLPWPREQTDHYRADDAEVMQTGKSKFHIIELLYQADGKKIWIDTNKVPLMDESGQIYGVLGIFQDITERKKAEESLIQSEARLKEAQQIGKIGSYELNYQTREFYWSDESYRIFGAEPGQGNPADIILSRLEGNAKKIFTEILDNIMSGKTNSFTEIEIQISDAENNKRYLQVRGNTVTDADGNPVRFSGTFQDVTERKYAEIAIQESRRKLAETNKMLKLIIDTIPIRVFWKSKDSVFLGCNMRFAEDAGYNTPEELIGKTDYDMPWKDQAEDYRRDDKEVMEKDLPKMNFEEMQTNAEGNQDLAPYQQSSVAKRGRRNHRNAGNL